MEQSARGITQSTSILAIWSAILKSFCEWTRPERQRRVFTRRWRSGLVRLGSSAEQPRREIVEVVSPVDPGVPAAADVQLVLDAVLFQHFRQLLRAGEGEVLVSDADREQLHRLVDLVGAFEEGRVSLLEVVGISTDAGTPDAHVGE